MNVDHGVGVLDESALRGSIGVNATNGAHPARKLRNDDCLVGRDRDVGTIDSHGTAQMTVNLDDIGDHLALARIMTMPTLRMAATIRLKMPASRQWWAA